MSKDIIFFFFADCGGCTFVLRLTLKAFHAGICATDLGHVQTQQQHLSNVLKTVLFSPSNILSLPPKQHKYTVWATYTEKWFSRKESITSLVVVQLVWEIPCCAGGRGGQAAPRHQRTSAYQPQLVCFVAHTHRHRMAE